MLCEIFAFALPQFIRRRIRSFVVCRSSRSRVLLIVVVLNIVFVFTLYGKGSRNASPTRLISHGSASYLKTHQVVNSDFNIETLDAVEIRKVMKQVNAVATDPCENFVGKQPKINMAEPQQWQMVVDGIPETFVFSAFYDGRYVVFVRSTCFVLYSILTSLEVVFVASAVLALLNLEDEQQHQKARGCCLDG